MPIANATNSTLSNIVQQLNLGQTPVNKELRSKGTDLYVRTGNKVFKSETSRTNHRNNAIDLVKGAMQREYNLTPGQVGRVLNNVFGQAPTQITAGDVNRLHDLGTDALRFTRGNTTPEQAFELATKVETLMSTGVGHTQASLRGEFAAELVGPGCTVDQAWSLARDLSIIAGNLQNGGVGQQEAIDRAKIVGQMLLADPNMPQDVAVRLSEDVRAKVANGMAMDVAVGHAVGTYQEVNAFVTGNGARPAVPQDRREMFLTCLRHQMQGLPPYEGANGGQKAQWLKLGECFGRIPNGEMRNFPLSQRNSMLAALSTEAATRVLNNDAVGAGEIYDKIARMGRGFPIGDLTPPSEVQRMDQFYDSVRNSPGLTNARDNWGTMDMNARRTAIREMMTLHSQQFGYQLPQLTFGDPGGGALGLYDRYTETLTINNVGAQFDDFSNVFNTVVHESTHRYQQHLIEQFRDGTIGVGDERYEQARAMDSNDRAPVTEGVLRGLNVAHPVAGYRNAPNETHAFHWGDHAQAFVQNWH